jgi:hypothetical protein
MGELLAISAVKGRSADLSALTPELERGSLSAALLDRVVLSIGAVDIVSL